MAPTSGAVLGDSLDHNREIDHDMRLERDTHADVCCIACGSTVPRSGAREYDKYGNRWDRDGKSFEYLCKPCFRECCHLNRDGLEAQLVEAGAGSVGRETFLSRYFENADIGTATEETG